MAISVEPSIRALIPFPDPPPESEMLVPGCIFMYASAVTWATGRTVVEPLMTMVSPARAVKPPKRLRAARHVRRTFSICFMILSSVFFSVERNDTSCLLRLCDSPVTVLLHNRLLSSHRLRDPVHGDLDLFVANFSQNNFLYTNNGDGSFTRITSDIVVSGGGYSWDCVWGDYDNDGDLDLFVPNGGDQNNFLYANNGNSNNWINIDCTGVASNVSAIGSKIKVNATINGDPVLQLREISGGTYSQDSLNVEFGLGDAEAIDEIRIEWPSGIVQTLTNVPVNQFLTVTEPETYDFVLKWGSEGSDDGQFSYPFDVAVDSSGDVYVTDNGNDRI